MNILELSSIFVKYALFKNGSSCPLILLALQSVIQIAVLRFRGLVEEGSPICQRVVGETVAAGSDGVGCGWIFVQMERLLEQE